MTRLGWTTQDAAVVVTMTHADWQYLLFLLGAAAGDASRNGDVQYRKAILALANRLNVGNPNYTPYDI